MAAAAGCGGVRERNLAVRVGWEAWADLPAIGHEAGEKSRRDESNILISTLV